MRASNIVIDDVRTKIAEIAKHMTLLDPATVQ